MMAKRITSICLALLLVFFTGAVPASAGGALESFDITGFVPVPGFPPSFVEARIIGIKWDSRCIPVEYSVNDTLDPVPNPLGADFLSLADATTALQESFDPWNEIATSFIDMQITGTTSNPGTRGFDFVNELTFRTPPGAGFIASSPSTNLILDSFLSDGDDVDGDGDSDVTAGIAICQDTDGDGDIEFPEGFYPAGTILDNDVQYNTDLFRFTVDPAAVDTVGLSVDLQGVAVHENGHSHGLSHVLNNQISENDGTGATMFPFIDTGDPDAELSQRSLDADDIIFSSFFYPEGSAPFGPGALQAGDVPFDDVFGLVTGAVHHGGQDLPLAGGSVFAIQEGDDDDDDDDGDDNGNNADTFLATAFSGTTRLAFSLITGGLFLHPVTIIDGNYTLPLPEGEYEIGVEAVDGFPVSATSVSFTAIIGSIFGQPNFNEEFFNRNKEGALELRPGQAKKVEVDEGETTSGIDIVTNRDFTISNFGDINFIGLTGAPPGRFYAVQIPAGQVSAAMAAGNTLIQAGNFFTDVVDASVVPAFAQAMLTTGVVNPDGTASIDLKRRLARARGFIGQDFDFTPLYFNNPQALGKRVQRGIDQGKIENLFLVLQVPTEAPFPGVSGVPPLIGLDAGEDIGLLGLSFVSDDGGATFTRVSSFNFMFSLVMSEPPPPSGDDDDDDD